MLASLKRLSKHSAIYGIGHIVTRLVNFALLPVYTNKIAADQFGVYAVIYMYIAFMTVIYTMGIDAAFLRFFILSDDVKKRKEIFSTAFWTVLTVGLVLTLIIYARPAKISSIFISEGSYPELFRLAALILLFDALAFLPFLHLRADEQSTRFVAIKFINVLVNVGMNAYYVIYLNKGVEGILLANLWASGLTFLLSLPILLKGIGFTFSKQEFKELLKFGLPYVPSTLSIVMLDLIDRMILERLLGLERTGIYSAGFRLGIFMNLFVAAFRFAWHPFFLSTSKQDDAKEIFARILTYFVLAGSVIFLSISFIVEDLVRLSFLGITLFGEAYWQGTRVVPVILLAYLINGMYVNFIVGIHLEKKTKYLPMITGIGVAVNVAANFLLLPVFDIMGAAYSKLGAYLVMTAVLYFIAQKFYPVKYEFGRLLKLAALVTVLFYLGSVLSGGWGVLARLALLALFLPGLWVLGFFEPRELNALKRLIRRSPGGAGVAS